MANRFEEVLESEQRKAKKIEALYALIRDPDLAEIVKKLQGESQPSVVRAAANGHHRPPVKSASEGNITAAVRELGPRLPKPFTVDDILKTLESDKFPFRREDHLDAVRDAIYFIVRKPNSPYRIVEQGVAGSISKYEFTG